MGYKKQQIVLHWIIVVLVAAQYLGHEAIADAFDRVIEGGPARITALVGLHIGSGFLVFALTLVRLGLRLTHGVPPPPEAEPTALRILAQGTHWAFYALLVLLPVSGAVAWFRQSEAAGDLHEVLRAVLLALIALHLAGVALHQFVWKTDILARMRRPG